GLPSKALVPSLFAFNAGVEIGQIVIVAVMLPLIWLIMRTHYKKQFIRATSAIILLFGATWFLNRAFDIPIAII
ncbi:MAG: HupE/UreJ family protein, partial [bacterium]